MVNKDEEGTTFFKGELIKQMSERAEGLAEKQTAVFIFFISPLIFLFSPHVFQMFLLRVELREVLKWGRAGSSQASASLPV